MDSKEMDKVLKQLMDVDNMQLDVPPAALVAEARQRVALRKMPEPARPGFFTGLLALLQPRLKTYQLGFSVVATCLCLVYSIEMNLQSRSSHGYSNYNANALSAANNTVSVNSSTILTSIPTLRN